jgi:hypothetical protein
MTAATNYTTNKFLVDNILRGQSNTPPTSLYFGLFVADQGYWVASHAYTSGQFVLPATPNGHIYKCTTSGTSGTNAAIFNTVTTPGQTVTDGTAVWTEETLVLVAGTYSTYPPECTYTSYARELVTSSLADWSGTQSQGSTTASTGSSTTLNSVALNTFNNNAVAFPAPTGNQTGVVAGMFIIDNATAGTSGNILFWSMLTNPKTINNGDAAPNFPQFAFELSWS